MWRSALPPDLEPLSTGPAHSGGPLTRTPGNVRGGRRARNHSGRRVRDTAVPAHPGGLEAVAPGVRQTDDLLPVVGADAGGGARDPDHLRARRPAAVP